MNIRTTMMGIALLGGLGLARGEEDVSVVGLIHQARTAAGSTNLATALDLTGQALALDPAYGEAWKQQGRVLMLLHRPREALPSFATAEHILDRDRELDTWKQHLLVDLGQYRQLADRLLHLPDRELAGEERGLITRVLATLLEQGDTAGAAQLADRWAKAAPDPQDRIWSGVLANLARRDREGALAQAREAQPAGRGSNPLAALACDRLGLAHLERQDPALAIEAFTQSLAFRPDGLTALRELGWAYRENDQPEQAIATWQRGLAVYPQAVAWLAWVADTRLQQGQARAAEESADALLAVQPGNERAQVIKLAALLMQQDGGAEPYAAEVRGQLDGRRIEARGRALAARRTGRPAEAAEHLESYLAGRTDDREVKAELLAVYGEWAARARRSERQIPLERMLALEPGHAGAQRDLGWLYWSRGEREKGLELLDQAIRNDVANRDEVIAQTYAALAETGQGARAAEYLKQWAPGTSMQDLARRLFRQGRLAAAEPTLELAWLAWANNQPPREIGILLAFTRALRGQCQDLTRYLDLNQPDAIDTLDDEQVDLCVEILTLCPDHPEAFARMKRLARQGGNRRKTVPHVTQLLELAADRSRQQQDYSLALRLYRRVLARDGERLCYLRAADCAEALGRRDVAMGLLEDVQRNARGEASRMGAAGRLAEFRGDLKRAVAQYQKSLIAAPDQADVRKALFGVLITLGRLVEAREQAAWFVQKYEAGARSLHSTLAEMASSLGDDERALQFWRELAAANPGLAYYAVEQARACFKRGQPGEALALLDQVNQRHEDVRAWQLQAEIYDALGQPDRVLVATERGLALGYTRELLRLRADAAEALNLPALALESARALLQDDPGHGAMARVVLRSWAALGHADEARAYAEGLWQRNPANLPALLALRRTALQDGRWREAIRWSEDVVRQRPWDLEAISRYSGALAADRQFGRALDVLRPHASERPGPPLVALFYRGVTTGPYPGRLTVAQVTGHLQRLADEGYRFMTPDQLSPGHPPASPSVLVVVGDTDPAALQALDQALAGLGGRASLAVLTSRDERQQPGQPSPAQIQSLLSQGRWSVISAGPVERERIPVDARGTLGQPLIQRQWEARAGRLESDQELEARVDALLADMAAPLPPSPRALAYPQGDYGQLALDLDPAALPVVYRTVGRHFNLGFAADDSGFITPGSDPLRMPIKFVPPDWTVDRLMQHLATANPALALQVQKAKTLYWNRQHEEANRWFAIALANGAPAAEVKYLWGANAYQQGDLPTSTRLLEEALALQPGNARIRQALRRSQTTAEPRLNLLAGFREDREDRQAWQAGGWARANLTRSWRPEALLDFNRWTGTDGRSSEGWRQGAGARWYARPQTWVDGRLYYLDYTERELHDFWGGFLRVRVAHPRGNGEVNLEASRDEVGTREAIQRAIEQWTYAIRSSTRLFNRADFTINGTYQDRDDVNDTRTVDGRLLWRVRERPDLGVGLYGEVADSWKDPAEYYAPMELHQYQLMAQWQGTQGRLNFQASAQAGYARAQYRNWRFAWSSRVLLEYAMWRKLYLFGDLNYLDTVGYQRWQTTGGLSTRF